jgi:circadian clock protein KaiC
LPAGRCTAVVGGPGAGKSIFALQNLLNRLRLDGEPGLFVSFEEPIDRVRRNLAAFDWSFDSVEADKLTLIDARLPVDTVLTGGFDLTGLLAGLSTRKAETGASNVVFDGIDILIGTLNDAQLERRELRRIDDWIQAEGLSAILTVKSYGLSERDQTRSDLIQYMTDCIVIVDATLIETCLSRTLRAVKFRGSGFAANPMPMVIGGSGIELIPAAITRDGYPTFSDRVSTGVERLDAILDGGFLRGSSILVTGAPGTAKTSLAASHVAAVCAAGKKALFVSFDESNARIVANMQSIGVDLASHLASGRLAMASLRSASQSPEECFLAIWSLVRAHKPDTLVVDPMSAFALSPYPFAEAIAEHLIDLAKSAGITFFGTSLLDQVKGELETSASHVSTIADTWLHLSYVIQNGERNRCLTIVKSRGTAHSNQVRELHLGKDGIDLIDVFAGEGSVLLGSARMEKLSNEKRSERLAEIDFRRRTLVFQREIAQLKARTKEASEELAAKITEVELEESAERVRLESKQIAIAERMRMRRQGDDRRGAQKKRRKGSRA